MRPSVASFFTGIGGLDLGFEWAGASITWATDISRIAEAAYPLNFRRVLQRIDIEDLEVSSVPDVDIVIGGPPCQSFSLVGLRKADDERGKLVFKFFEVVKAKRPAGFVMENVPGLAAARINDERLTHHLANKFQDIGYHVTVMKLNAADYLVPQLRKRVFIVGSLKAPVVVPEKESFSQEVFDARNSEFNLGSASALQDLGPPVAKGDRASYSGAAASKFAQIMRGSTLDFTLHEMPRMSSTDKLLVSFIPPGGNYMDVPDEHATQRILNFKKSGGRTTTYGRLHPDRPAYTINTYFRRPNVGANFHPTEERLISVREAMRLQSLPDRFDIPKIGAQDDRNALVGNAVPPLLAMAVARELLKSLGFCVKSDVPSFRAVRSA